MKVTPELLARVAQDNIRDHQIGETRDGISWEAARDMGFLPVEEAAQLVPVVPEAPAQRKHLTIAQQNANERKAIETHYRLMDEIHSHYLSNN